jgi:hypothetical protein
MQIYGPWGRAIQTLVMLINGPVPRARLGGAEHFIDARPVVDDRLWFVLLA